MRAGGMIGCRMPVAPPTRMPDSRSAGWCRPVLATVLAAAALTACGGPEAPHAATATATAADPAPQPSRPVKLQCMPNALVSLALPLEEGLSAALDAAPAGPALADCVLGLFAGRAFKSPAAFDPAYGRVFAYHEEHGALALRSLPRDGLQVWRLGNTSQANVWLLRVDAGTALEDAHYDIIASTARSDGALVDDLLIGAIGLLYRRDYDLMAADAFSIREDTGRGAETGPGYRARYRTLEDGRFRLVSSEVVPAAVAAQQAQEPAP